MLLLQHIWCHILFTWRPMQISLNCDGTRRKTLRRCWSILTRPYQQWSMTEFSHPLKQGSSGASEHSKKEKQFSPSDLLSCSHSCQNLRMKKYLLYNVNQFFFWEETSCLSPCWGSGSCLQTQMTSAVCFPERPVPRNTVVLTCMDFYCHLSQAAGGAVN